MLRGQRRSVGILPLQCCGRSVTYNLLALPVQLRLMNVGDVVDVMQVLPR
jgi:hypothetical protein